MGKIIFPNGVSKPTEKFEGSVLYEELIDKLHDENIDKSCKAKLLFVLSEMGNHGELTEKAIKIADKISGCLEPMLASLAKQSLDKFNKKESTKTNSVVDWMP